MMKRPLKILTAALAVIVLFTACKQLLDDPEDFLSYWASEAFVKDRSIVSAHRPDGAGVPCVGSSDNVLITLTAHNPKNFPFVMPSSSEPAGIVEFKELSHQPAAGADYELKQTGSGTLVLTYKQDFLKRYEQGSAALNPTITLKAKDGRVFKQTYTFGIKSNTPPPKPKEIVLAKTKITGTETISYYVLCLQFDSAEMTKKVTIGSGTVPIHKDIAKITINDSPYTLLYKEDNSDFQKPAETFSIGSFIESGNVEILDSSSPDVPSGWVLYFKTGIQVQSTNPQTSYTITLSDNKGVVSDVFTAELKKKFKVTFNSQDGSPVPAQYIENNGKVTRPTDPTKTGYIFGGWYKNATCSGGQEWNFATDTVTSNITLYAKWTAGSGTQYKVEHYQQNIDDDNNYTIVSNDTQTLYGNTNDPITVTQKNYPGFEYAHMVPGYPTIGADGNTVVKLYYNRKQITVTFKPSGGKLDGNVNDVTKTGKYGAPLTVPDAEWTGHTFSGWNPPLPATPTFPAENAEYTAEWNLNSYTVTYLVEIVDGEAGGTIQTSSGSPTTNGTVSVTHGGSVTFTGRPATGDWKVAGWTVSQGVFASNPGTSTTATLSDVKEPKTVTVKFYQSTLKNPATWKDLARAVKSAPDNATLTIDGEIQATDVANNESRIKVKKNLTIKGENNAVLNAVGKEGIFDVYRTFTLQDITLKNSALPSEYSGSGGVYVDSYGKFIMKGSSVITGCSAANSGGGVYVGGGTFEMHDSSAITGCTASKGGGVYVSSGTFKMQDSAIVTPSTGSDANKPGKNDVYLESKKTITVGGTLSSNPAARITPQSYTENTQVLTGNITGGSSQNRKKFIIPPQDVTVGSENGKMFWYISATGLLKAEVEDLETLKEAIDAAPNNTPFIIKLAGTIDDLQTVQIPGYKKIMLKADNASKPAILKCPKKDQNDYKHLQVQRDATLILEGLITLQGADYKGNTQYALYVENGGKAEIKDGVIITGFKNGNIGPVVSDGNLTMSGGEISGNKAKNGGGVYIHASWRYFTMTGGTIKGNTADKGGGVYVNGSLNGGYPIRGQFLMKGGTITGNTAETNGKAVFVYHGDFKWESGQITANTGSGAAVATDLSGNFNNSTNPHQEPS